MPYEYVVNGQVISLAVVPDRVAVRFNATAAAAPEAVRDLRANAAAALFPADPDESPVILPEGYVVMNVAPPQLAAGAAGAAAPSTPSEDALPALNADATVERASPVFDLGETQAVASNRVLVGVNPGVMNVPPVLNQIAPNASVESRGENEYIIHLPDSLDPFAVISRLAADPAVSYAEPDFIVFGKHPSRPTPPMDAAAMPAAVADQYMARITQADVVWQYYKGDPAVRIAVLDEGVDAGHPDLSAALVGQYDAPTGSPVQAPNVWDGHGTACAGLAAGMTKKGFRGVGGGCSLMAARIAYSPSDGANWVTTNRWIADAIDWAWRNGAAVLSNSWGGGAPSGAVSTAFERARRRGRGGKGSVIVIAAGNNAGPVTFPGNLPDVLTISASNEFDEPKTKLSRDGEGWWGSNFGREISLAAPGVHNLTTDISGGGGYDPTDYFATFNGTSSATPIVAGAAGMILSANPELTEAQVRQILMETADKVSSVTFVDGFNEKMGYGRLNVRRAVEAAKAAGGAALLAGIRPADGPQPTISLHPARAMRFVVIAVTSQMGGFGPPPFGSAVSAFLQHPGNPTLAAQVAGITLGIYVGDDSQLAGIFPFCWSQLLAILAQNGFPTAPAQTPPSVSRATSYGFLGMYLAHAYNAANPFFAAAGAASPSEAVRPRFLSPFDLSPADVAGVFPEDADFV